MTFDGSAIPSSLGKDNNGRNLYALDLANPEDFPEELQLWSIRFICLMAWDARGVSDEAIRRIAARLLDEGAVYLCCWGPDCERVHDLVDAVDIARNPSCEPVVMTTWHAREPLSDAIWFALNCAYPDVGYEEGCRSVLAISIGNVAWSAEIRAALSRDATNSNG